MKNYGIIYGEATPKTVDITPNEVLVASDIQEYEKTFDDVTVHGYQYNLVGYTKDEYLEILANENATLAEELKAAKIILGVE